MKKLYNKYFYIPKHQKISDKVVLVRVVLMVCIVIACLTAMTLSAYAYFSHSVSSNFNIIKSAYFDVDIEIVSNGDKIAVKKSEEDASMYADLTQGEYSVTLKLSDRSTAKTGFVVISTLLDDKKVNYYTQQLGVDEATKSKKRDSLSFKIIAKSNSRISFLSHWGTSHYYEDYITDNVASENYITQKDPDFEITVGSTEVTVNKEKTDTKVAVKSNKVSSTASSVVADESKIEVSSVKQESSSTENTQEEQNESELEKTEHNVEESNQSSENSSSEDDTSESIIEKTESELEIASSSEQISDIPSAEAELTIQ